MRTQNTLHREGGR